MVGPLTRGSSLGSRMSGLEPQMTDALPEGDALPVGTVLLRDSYELTRFIASGGFGKTYLAKDILDRTVVVKECFPAAVCFRKGTSVEPMSRASEDEFRTLVDLFKSEARNLSKIDHPNVVKVHQVFDDNNTAYMVLDYVDGRDLGTVLADKETPLKPEVVTAIANDLIDAVATIHDANVLHRDISPDNILLTSDNTPVLIDFGAARQLAGSTSRKLSEMRMVKDGYSPQEFYSSNDGMHPSSDLYSLAATLHHAIVGYPPPNAQERVLSVGSGADDLYLPIALQARGYDRTFLEAIDRALGLFPIDRPQNVKEWRQLQKGLRIPNRSKRREADVSRALIHQLVEESTNPPEPEVEEVLRPLRTLGDIPPETAAAERGPVLYAGLTLLAGLAATNIYLNAMGGAPDFTRQISSIGLTSFDASRLPAGAVTLASGTVLAPHQQDGRSATWVVTTQPGSQSPFLRGDVLVSVLPDRTPITTPDVLQSVISDAARLNRQKLDIAVWRDNRIQIIPLEISIQSIDKKQ